MNQQIAAVEVRATVDTKELWAALDGLTTALDGFDPEEVIIKLQGVCNAATDLGDATVLPSCADDQAVFIGSMAASFAAMLNILAKLKKVGEAAATAGKSILTAKGITAKQLRTATDALLALPEPQWNAEFEES